jgi:hypothetical protein
VVYVSPAALEAVGAQVTWVASPKPKPGEKYIEAFQRYYGQKVIGVGKGEVKVEFRFGEKTAQVNGEEVALDSPARFIDGLPMVPLEAVKDRLSLALEVLIPLAESSDEEKADEEDTSDDAPTNPPQSRDPGGTSPQGSPPVRSSYFPVGVGVAGLLAIGLGWLAWRRGRR